MISVAMAPKDGLFATGSGDNKARIWKVESNLSLTSSDPMDERK